MPLRDLALTFTTPETARDIADLLIAVGGALGVSAIDAPHLVDVVWGCLTSQPLDGAEREIREWIDAHAGDSDLTVRMAERAVQIVAQISPYVVGQRIADIGCGDGLVSAAFAPDREVVLTDVVDYVDKRVPIPLVLYGGAGPLPIAPSVDSSLLLTVLHHAEDPVALFEETARVTRQRIIIIESVVPPSDAESFASEFEFAAFFDWFYNRVLHKDVPVPYNYNSTNGWTALFQAHGWQIANVIDLGRDQPLVPEHHMLFVLDRGDASRPALRA